MRNGDWLVSLVEDWFYSDLDIEFALKRDPDEETIANAIHGVKDEVTLLCSFESDVWYDHTVRGSPRHGGNLRRFMVLSGDDGLYEAVEGHCNVLYDKSGIIDLIHILDEDYTILNAEDAPFWRTMENEKIAERVSRALHPLKVNIVVVAFQGVISEVYAFYDGCGAVKKENDIRNAPDFDDVDEDVDVFCDVPVK